MSSATPSLDQPIVSEPSAPASEIDRWQHTRLRRRILYGQWRDDLKARVTSELQSEERAEAWGEPDLSADIYSPACETRAALYTPEPPRVGGKRPVGAAPDSPLPPLPAGSEALLEAVADGGMWDIMPRLQRDTIGLREMILFIEGNGSEASPGLSFRPIFPDRAIVRAGAKGPRDVPAWLSYADFEAREDGIARWYWHEWCIDAEEPYYRVFRDDNHELVVHEQAGEEYPYFSSTGEPVIPAVLYHAERTGYLWDPYQEMRLVEGALRLGVLWTFYGHLIRNASWPLRWMLACFVSTESSEVDSIGNTARPPRLRVVTDPAIVLTLQVDPDSTVPPQVGSFPPGADPLAVAQSIELFERRIVGLAGLDSAAVSRKEGDPRSGYALAVSDNAKTELRKRYAPAFRRGDLQALRVAAVVLGSLTGETYPETGYGIEYGPPPLPVEPSNKPAGDPAVDTGEM